MFSLYRKTIKTKQKLKKLYDTVFIPLINTKLEDVKLEQEYLNKIYFNLNDINIKDLIDYCARRMPLDEFKELLRKLEKVVRSVKEKNLAKKTVAKILEDTSLLIYNEEAPKILDKTKYGKAISQYFKTRGRFVANEINKILEQMEIHGRNIVDNDKKLYIAYARLKYYKLICFYVPI